MRISDWSSDVCSSDLNSSLALERLRGIVDQLEQEGRRQLPTERELAEQIGVGRRAVRRALEVLEAEGRIWRRQGAGTFIGAAPHRAEHHLKKLHEVYHMREGMEVRLRQEPALAAPAALRSGRRRGGEGGGMTSRAWKWAEQK